MTARTIALALPLLIVWVLIGFQTSKKEGEAGSVNRVTGSDARGADRREPLGDRQIGEGLTGQRDLVDFSPLEEFHRGPEAGGVQAMVQLVWSKIDSGLLEALSAEERHNLRRYIAEMIETGVAGQVWACWGEGVMESKAEAYHAAERLAGAVGGGYSASARQFLSGGRWTRTASDGFAFGSQGDTSIVTWSIVPDGTLAPGLSNGSSSPSNLRAWMASIYGGSAIGAAEDQPWFPIFEDAMEAMAATCGLTLVYEANDDAATSNASTLGELGVRGDIRIAARALDGNGGNLGIAFGPNNGDIVFDSSDATFDNTSGNSIRLFNTIAHEAGHSLGLAHVCPVNRTKLMEPILTTSLRGPQFDEHQSLQRLYGDPLEAHVNFRENDSPTSATSIELTEGSALSLPRLSIDDNTDEDYFSFNGLVGQRLVVEVEPGEGNYLEGGETAGVCSPGSEFRSGDVHDLTIQVVDVDGETVLLESSSEGLGGIESIEQFELPASGTYYLKVDGDFSNDAQLYELRAELLARIPAPRLSLADVRILEESGSVKNGRLDSGESVRIILEIENEGDLPAESVVTSVTPSPNSIVFSQSNVAQILAGETAEIELVIGSTGACGESVDLSVLMNGSSGTLFDEVVTLGIGLIERPIAFEADFDEGNELPPAWSTSTMGSGEEWESVLSRSSSPSRSAFTPGRDSVGESYLLSPTFQLAADGGTLTFRHLHRLEPGFDGGILEVSRGGAAWVDLLLEPEAEVTEGGYNRMISEMFGSAIAGRQAWSGIQGDFTDVAIELPKSWAGESLQFRWRVVYDSSSGRDGWWVDDVRVEMLVEECEAHRPELSLSLTNGALDENYPDQLAVLALSSNLPLVLPLNIPLATSGMAELGNDVTGDFLVTFPAGHTVLEIPLQVVADELAEGDENLWVGIPDDREEFAPGGQASVELLVKDRVNLSAWSVEFFQGEVDLFADSDGDGFVELAEYLLGTNPTEASERPHLTLESSESGEFLIPLGPIPLRTDAVLGVEISGDLEVWTPGTFLRTSEGLEVSLSQGSPYLRLTFSLLP